MKVQHSNEVKPQKNKKIVFDDDGNTMDVVIDAAADTTNRKHSNGPSKKLNNKANAKANIESDFGRWYEEVRTFLMQIPSIHHMYSNNRQQYTEYNLNENLVELKDVEIKELSNFCRLCFQAEETSFLKSELAAMFL